MNSASARERVYKIFAESDPDVEEKVNRALAVGTDYFDIPIGFFTRFIDDDQRIVCAVGEHPLIQPGESCPLEQSYCRHAVDADGVLAVQDASVSSISDSAINTFNLGTYIGMQVVVDDDIYGTICFAAEDERDEPFSESQEIFLELLATLIGTALERQQYEREIEARNERLREQKQRFEGIAENSSDIIFRVDTDAQFTYVSAAVERILGYEPETMVGQQFYDYLCESGIETADPAYERLLTGTPVEGLVLDFLDVNDQAVTLEINATPVTDDGEVVGVQGVGRDVTERQAQQRELRIKNRAMDDATMGITIVDPHQPNDPMIYINDGFERLTGYSEAEALGRNCRFLQGEGTDPEAVARFREAIEAGESTTVELLNYRKNGTPFWNRVQINPVFDESELTQYLGFQTDVTERRRTEQLIQLLNRVLRHNLRNGMSVVGGSAATLPDADRDQLRETSDRLARVSDELTGLSEQARDLEATARTERSPERLDVDGLLDSLADSARHRWPDADVSVTVETDADACAGPELERALSELLENAVKHNPSPSPTVEITTTREAEWLEITVRDDGPGIDDMERAAINTGTETGLEHGSGLGLWLVNWIVTRYGGSFRLPENDSDDTTALVRVPAITDDQSVSDVERGPTVLFR
ncbi:PAS domain S-box protein [Halovenus halobia]|uniref:PAS domain S-box protein n=1 Tax=Halovenus halobia TaxID=3396622 RepID=UPI003F550F1C